MTSTNVSHSHFALALPAHQPLRCTMVGSREPALPFRQPKRTRQDLVLFFVLRGDLSLIDYTPAGEHHTLSQPGTLHTAGPGMAQASAAPFMPGSCFLWWHIESEGEHRWLTRQETVAMLQTQTQTRDRTHWLIPRHWPMLEDMDTITDLHSELMRQAHAWGIGDPGLDADATHLLRRIHSHLTRHAYRIELADHEEERGRRVIQTALVHLMEHITRFHTREDLAAVCRCSPSYLSRCFTRYTNRTLKDTMAHYRIELAKTMLASPDATPKEVAYLCGYTSLNYFCRQFKQQTSSTVRQWMTSQSAT